MEQRFLFIQTFTSVQSSGPLEYWNPGLISAQDVFVCVLLSRKMAHFPNQRIRLHV